MAELKFIGRPGCFASVIFDKSFPARAKGTKNRAARFLLRSSIAAEGNRNGFQDL
jgi:hypothetical protein